MNNHNSHAKIPVKENFGKSTTALYFEIIAADPLLL